MLPFFSLERIRNTGIAFGQLAGQKEIVTVLTLGALAWMVVFFARAGARSPLRARRPSACSWAVPRPTSPTGCAPAR